MGAETRSRLRFVAPLLILSIAGNVWLLVSSWRPSRVANAGQQTGPVHVAPLVRRGGPRVRAALQPFLPSGGGRAEAGVRCGPAAQALEAEIQSARSQLEGVLPASLLFAAGAASPEVTGTFQGTVNRIVGAREKTVVGHTFDCTERACRLSMLIDGEDSTWLDDLRVSLVRAHGNAPLLAVSSGKNLVERPGQSPLAQVDVFFKVSPIDKLAGEEADAVRAFIRELGESTPVAAENGS